MVKRVFIVSGFVLMIALAAWMLFFPSVKESSSSEINKAALAKDIIKMRLGHNMASDSALHEAALLFAKEVKHKSSGRVEIEIFPSQAIGNDDAMIEMARDGKLDILVTPTAKMSVSVPSMQYADLPFFFPSSEDLYAMLDGEPGKMMLDDLSKIGLVGVTFWGNGFKHFTGNKPFLSPDDFKGQKIRVMKSRMIMEQFKNLGAEPVVIDFYATKQALEDRVVDAQENPLVAIVGMDFYKAQTDLTLSSHAYLAYVFCFSEKIFKKLPHELQLMLIETAKEITPIERQETQRREQKFIETIKNAGITIHELKDEERQKFAQKLANVPKKFEDVIGAHIISKTEELLYKKYALDSKNKEDIVIAIDADLSMDAKTAGLAIKRGVSMAVEEINAKGGVLGRQLVVLAKDHRSIASVGVENVKTFIETPDVVAVVGGLHSAVIVDEMKTIQESKIPYLVPWAAASEIIENGYEQNYLFRISANDKDASLFIAEYALKNYKKPAIIVENSIWGRSNLERMSAYLHKMGIDSVVSIVYNRGQTSFQNEIGQIVASGADSIIMVANSKEGSHIFEEVAKQNKILPIVSHWGIVGGDFFEENKEHIKKVDLHFFQTFSFVGSSNDVQKEMQKSYMQKYGEEFTQKTKAFNGVLQAYDLTHMLALAIKNAGTTERTKVKEALENLPLYMGVVKNYTKAFTQEKHDALDKRDYFMAKFGVNGEIIPIKK